MDAYTWNAVYADGGELAEADAGTFGAVDRARVVRLTLRPVRAGLHPVSVDVPAGAAPVCFRRRQVRVSGGSGESQPGPSLTCLGWERDGAGAYLFVTDRGGVLLTHDRQSAQPDPE